jgi:hypothetical protein
MLKVFSGIGNCRLRRVEDNFANHVKEWVMELL